MDAEIVVFEGFDELDAIGPYEVLANACRFAGEGSVRLVALDGESVAASGSPSGTRAPGEREPMVTASHGLRVGVDGVLGDSNPDLVVVPGGGWNDRDSPGAWTEAEDGRLPAALADQDATLASVCTGGMLLAEAGLLDGVPSVTHHSAVDDLRETGADVRDARVVDAGRILTAGGVTSGLDLAFHLVIREFGDEIAERVAREMEYEPSDDVLVV